MKKVLFSQSSYVLLLLVVVFLSSFSLQKIIKESASKKEVFKVKNTGFAVLELFTSQGCSSCPPADVILAKYAVENNQNIIPLAFHVDYWNYIGWKDPFSKAEFSKRQSDYAHFMHSQGNYTPQLIINGKHELVGSKENTIQKIVTEELALNKEYSISITKANSKDHQIIVDFKSEKTLPNTVINLALVKKKEFTSIKRGENTGLKQTSYNIVIDFKTVSSSSITTSFEFNKEGVSSDYFIVAYLQDSTSGKILTATKSEIN